MEEEQDALLKERKDRDKDFEIKLLKNRLDSLVDDVERQQDSLKRAREAGAFASTWATFSTILLLIVGGTWLVTGAPVVAGWVISGVIAIGFSVVALLFITSVVEDYWKDYR